MLRLLEGFESYGILGRTGVSLRDDIRQAHYTTSTGLTLVEGRSGTGLGLFLPKGEGGLSLSRYDPFQSETWIMGWAAYLPLDPITPVTIWFEDALGLTLNRATGGSLILYHVDWSPRNIMIPSTWRAGTWVYIEIKWTAHASAATVEIHVNGQSVYSGSGLALPDGGDVSGSHLKLYTPGSWGEGMIFDDIYICDGAGSYNNDFLGPIVVETLRPISDDGTQNWTPSSGVDHYALVDSANMWQTTDYVEASTPVDDLWGYSNLSIVNGTIHGVQSMSIGWTDTSLPQALQTICKSGATTANTESRGLGADQRPSPQDGIWEIDPNTSLPWTIANLNAASFGIRSI